MSDFEFLSSIKFRNCFALQKSKLSFNYTDLIINKLNKSERSKLVLS